MTGPLKPDEDPNNGEVVAVLCLSERTLRPFFYHNKRFEFDFKQIKTCLFTLLCLGGLLVLRFFLDKV